MNDSAKLGKARRDKKQKLRRRRQREIGNEAKPQNNDVEQDKGHTIWQTLSVAKRAELKQFRRWLDNEQRKPHMGGLTEQGAEDLLEWSRSGDPARPPWDLYSKRRVMEDSAQDTLNRFLAEKSAHARAQGVVVGKLNGEEDDAVRDWWNWIDGRGKMVKRTVIGNDGKARTMRGRERHIPKDVFNKTNEEDEGEEDDEDDDDDDGDEGVPLAVGSYRLQ
ncbi:MAG: hypothetical protein Q9183_004853 [Haloplaca sp. 2 TL-2023]